MNYAKINDYDIANGIGVRVSLFVSGCTHHCKGCFNPETWDFCYGQKFTEETEEHILHALQPDYIKGLTLLGGEPFEKANQKDLCHLIKRVKQTFPNKNIWCYSGYLFDQDLCEGGKVFTEYTKDMLKNIDVLVDGEFVLELKNLKLKFRGSSNQRIIDIQKSIKENKVILIADENI